LNDDLRAEIDSLRTRRRNVRFEELDRLLRRAGLARRSGRGDHWVYDHPRLARVLVIDPRTPLLPAYVSAAIRALEAVLEDNDS